MRRKSFDRLASYTGLLLTAVLAVAGALLLWASSFVHDQVHTQLSAQQIYFPASTDKSVAGSEFAEMRKYGGQQLTTGAQAKTYADHFIAVHLKEIGGGKTYAQLSAESLANPDDTALAGKVQTVFRGETLRGLLLDAYAFDTMGSIAGIAAICAFVAAGVMAVLSGLGIWHAGRVKPDASIFALAGGD